jgi:hypothetical protein
MTTFETGVILGALLLGAIPASVFSVLIWKDNKVIGGLTALVGFVVGLAGGLLFGAPYILLNYLAKSLTEKNK